MKTKRISLPNLVKVLDKDFMGNSEVLNLTGVDLPESLQGLRVYTQNHSCCCGCQDFGINENIVLVREY